MTFLAPADVQRLTGVDAARKCKREGWSRCGPKPKSLADRINESTRRTESGCVVWLKGVNKAGYGQIKVSGRTLVVHRVVYALFFGPIPAGMFVCHKCDNPPCCNPDHLFIGTALDNFHDCLNKGRWRPGRGNRKRGINHAGSTKLNEHEVKTILSMDCSNSEIARRLGIGRKVVSLIKLGRHWSVELLNDHG